MQQISYDLCLFRNDKHPVTKTFTPFNYTCRHFVSSHLNITHLHLNTHHYPLIWIKHI